MNCAAIDRSFWRFAETRARQTFLIGNPPNYKYSLNMPPLVTLPLHLNHLLILHFHHYSLSKQSIHLHLPLCPSSSFPSSSSISSATSSMPSHKTTYPANTLPSIPTRLCLPLP